MSTKQGSQWLEKTGRMSHQALGSSRRINQQNKPDVIPSPTMSGSPRGKVSMILQQHQLLDEQTAWHQWSSSLRGVHQNYPPRVMPAASPNTTSSQSSNQSQVSDQLSKTNLYIRGLNASTTDKDLVTLCQPYGKITSTKAIIDQQTNKCKGYGFVDFEAPQAADLAVQALQSKGIQAQMAKAVSPLRARSMEEDELKRISTSGVKDPLMQQEQDPTNLYIANLPQYFTEEHLEQMFKDYGTVISTRILRKPDGISRGVGFARMESREKCEQIIQTFNGKIIAGCKEPLLVKFADGGNKKKNQFPQARHWSERGEGIPMAYDQPTIAQNGVGAPAMMTPGGMMPRYSVATTPGTTYQVQSTNPGWMHPQYIMQPPMAHMIPTTVHPGSHTLDPNSVMPTLTGQIGQLQLSNTSYVSGPHAYTQIPYHQPQSSAVVQTVPVEDHSATIGNDESQHHYQTYQPATAK